MRDSRHGTVVPCGIEIYRRNHLNTRQDTAKRRRKGPTYRGLTGQGLPAAGGIRACAVTTKHHLTKRVSRSVNIIVCDFLGAPGEPEGVAADAFIMIAVKLFFGLGQRQSGYASARGMPDTCGAELRQFWAPQITPAAQALRFFRNVV